VYDVVLVVDQRENLRGGRTARMEINREVITSLCTQHDIRAAVAQM
jgi:hypothetical protein